MLDELDRAILVHLQMHGRISNVDLARRVNLSPPAVHARVKRLEEDGYVREYVALVDREKLGYDLLCFVSVRLQQQPVELVHGFRAAVGAMDEVLECHHVTGESDYLLKVAVRGRKDLESFLVERLTTIQGVVHVRTSVVLREVKRTTALPIR